MNQSHFDGFPLATRRVFLFTYDWQLAPPSVDGVETLHVQCVSNRTLAMYSRHLMLRASERLAEMDPVNSSGEFPATLLVACRS